MLRSLHLIEVESIIAKKKKTLVFDFGLEFGSWLHLLARFVWCSVNSYQVNSYPS